MSTQDVYTLVNPQTGQLAFKLYRFDDGRYFDHIQRNNYYSLVWMETAAGTARVDVAEYELQPDTLYAFSPYQPFMFAATELSGIAIHFHPDFFCIHKHQKEVACNGVLFNNIYQPPNTGIDAASAATMQLVITQMTDELQRPALAQYELLVSYLKIFLITASRLKVSGHTKIAVETAQLKEPFILQELKDTIEKDFRTQHSAAHYAGALNISPKALAKAAKNYFNKTLTTLIAERIIIEAKRELYLTDKTVKEIAYSLGYADEFYFSRFFKTNTDVSPQLYRDTVGHGRGLPLAVV